MQRAGRCNRDGTLDEAELLWARPPKAPPYDADDIDESVKALQEFDEQRAVSVEELQSLDIRTTDRVTPVIRRKDLIELFDTSPDLSGNDVDVARFIRAKEDRSVHVAWRNVVAGWPDGGSPHSEEQCRVPIPGLLKTRAQLHRKAWFLDHLSRDRNQPWKRCTPDDLRDGLEVVLDANEGGYDPEVGWNNKSKRPVEVISSREGGHDRHSFDDDISVGDDPASLACGWYPLTDHLKDVQRECATLLKSFQAGEARTGGSPRIGEARTSGSFQADGSFRTGGSPPDRPDSQLRCVGRLSARDGSTISGRRFECGRMPLCAQRIPTAEFVSPKADRTRRPTITSA